MCKHFCTGTPTFVYISVRVKCASGVRFDMWGHAYADGKKERNKQTKKGRKEVSK
jgi:hypothetical protein